MDSLVTFMVTLLRALPVTEVLFITILLLVYDNKEIAKAVPRALFTAIILWTVLWVMVQSSICASQGAADVVACVLEKVAL